MSNTKALIVAAAIVAAFSTIFLQHRQNAALVQEMAAFKEEKARIESKSAPAQAAVIDESTQRKIQELESEVTRLRGIAVRVAGATSEVAQLRAELQRLRSGQPRLTADSSDFNVDPLAQYIGSSVTAPVNLDPAYSKQGLAGAVQAAGDKAGITLKKIAVDDSEFPFLLGITSEPGDWEKLKAQFKTMNGYEYFGSVGDDTSHTFSMTPSTAYPAGSSQNITRRMTLRMQAFYNKFTAGEN